MKYIIGISAICMLTVVTSSFAGAIEAPREHPYAINAEGSSLDRYVLIADAGSNHVIMVNNAGTVIREITGLNNPYSADLLVNGDILVSESDGGCVVEFNINGTAIWQKTGLDSPADSERLTNGNTLIAENPPSGSGRVIEVDSAGTVVWGKDGLVNPVSAERLTNGNTLIAELTGNRVIEVDVLGTIVWQKTGVQAPSDAKRLTNGNTLIAEFMGGCVIEVNSAGTIVWQKTGLDGPYAAQRLPNSDTLIADYSGVVIEVNSAGTIVWQKTGLFAPYDARGFFSSPPNPPIIDGPANGKIKEPIPYVFVATDPDNDNIFYYIDWGDTTNSGWVGSHPSNEQINLTHTWTKKGTYIIKAKVKDIFSAESDWTTLSITMPQNNEAFRTHPLLSWLLEQFPHAFPTLRLLLKR